MAHARPEFANRVPASSVGKTLRRPAKCSINSSEATAPRSDSPLFCPADEGGEISTHWLTYQSICKIVKAYSERIKLRAADFGAHSLRDGPMAGEGVPKYSEVGPLTCQR
jgi:hypothetical protein